MTLSAILVILALVFALLSLFPIVPARLPLVTVAVVFLALAALLTGGTIRVS